jgi:hypothetical protein
MIDQNFAEETVGARPPQSFILDATVLEMEEAREIIREDVKQNRVTYEFPEGLNQPDIFEECRALTTLEDFDAWYDLSMQMLVGKPVVISILNLDGTGSELCAFQVTDRHMNLRGVDAISEYPWLVVWMVEFIKGYVSKKFPLPGKSLPQPQAVENRSGKTPETSREGQTTT